MDLSKRCKEFWGIKPTITPFGTHIEASDGLFCWPEFDDLVDRIAEAVSRRKFLIVAGAACSAKTVAWTQAKRRLDAKGIVHFCEPAGLAPDLYRDQTIYHCIKYAINPPDGSRENHFRRFREDRAMQCRQLLEGANAQGQAVCVAINDAHLCGRGFLLVCKRLWDDLDGFDRLVSIILIGQPALVSAVAGCPEISERSEVAWAPGLGSHIGEYIDHECLRAGLSHSPFASDAVERLARLRKDRPRDTADHPLIVNNIVSRALHDAWRIKAQEVDAEIMANAMRTEAMA